MTQNFGAKLFYNYTHSDLINVMKLVLNDLGFEPKFMSLYYENHFDLDTIKYDKIELENFLKKPLTSILIKNELDNEKGDLTWFRLKVDSVYYHIFNIEWNNLSLEFLNSAFYFEKLRKNKTFICQYFFDSNDSFFQTNKSITFHKLNLPHLAFKTTTDQFKDLVIDTSNNWGRVEKSAGLEFMAAPLMWFGDSFFKIISKEKLLLFENSVLLKNNNGEIIYVKLFELSDLASKDENRKKQHSFWVFFDLKNTIEKYSKHNSISEESWIQSELALKNKKTK